MIPMLRGTTASRTGYSTTFLRTSLASVRTFPSKVPPQACREKTTPASSDIPVRALLQGDTAILLAYTPYERSSTFHPASPMEVRLALEGKVIEQTELMGTF